MYQEIPEFFLRKSGNGGVCQEIQNEFFCEKSGVMYIAFK